MPWVRKLPSGLWAATVRLPGDKKLTKSFPLKGTADKWAAAHVASIHSGDFIDPRTAKVTVSAWRERSAGARRVELATRKWEQSIWSNHVEPRWHRVEVGAILRPDINAWIIDMEKDKVGAHTIIGAVNVLSALLEQAVDARMIPANPARGCKLPRLPAHVDRVITPDEERVILASLRNKFGDRADGELFVAFLLETGVRWEEAAAVRRQAIDMRQRIVNIGPVMERDGTIREYAKSEAGNRPVPIGSEIWPRLRDLALTRKPGELLFITPPKAITGKRPRGFIGPMQLLRWEPSASLNYHNWLKRIWNAALCEVETGPRGKIMSRTPIVAEPLPTPHDCRHTFGTRLAEQNVPEHEIGALMGHSPKSRATSRYIHAGNVRFDRARDALEKARGSSAAHDVG